MKNRIISLALTLAMVFGMMPAFSFNAFAAEPVADVTIDLSKPGSDSDKGYSYNSTNKVLTLSGKGKTYELTKTLTTGHVIVTADCTVILNNATITAGTAYTQSFTYSNMYSTSASTSTAAFSVMGNTECNLVLATGSSNTLTGTSLSAAISVQNAIDSTGKVYLASITIDGNGSLTATGGAESSAIGGNHNRPTGNITINSGNITARGGAWAPAIGDGDSKAGFLWSCADPDVLATRKATGTLGSGYDTDGDGIKDTCVPARIEINGGTIYAKAGKATPGIGTSDELSGNASTTASSSGNAGSGKQNNIWLGQTIVINGGSIVSIGGIENRVAVGAGRYTIMGEDSIVINSTKENPLQLLALSVGLSGNVGYAIHNSGMGYHQTQPVISLSSTANVFSFKYNNGVQPSEVVFTEIINGVEFPMTEYPQSTINRTDVKGDLVSNSKSQKVFTGMAVVLPDGTYKVDAGNESTVILEGGGMTYGDLSEGSIYSVSVNTYLDYVDGKTPEEDKENYRWYTSQHGKTFVLRIPDDEKDITNFAVAGSAEGVKYYVYEKIGSTYIKRGEAVVYNGPVTVDVYYYSLSFTDEDEGDLGDQYFHVDEATGEVTIDVPEKDGYKPVFKVDGVPVEKKQIEEMLKNGPVAVEVVWNAKEYTVAFDANGGDGDMDNMTGVVFDVDTAITENDFTREGYIFKGWSLSEETEYDVDNASSKTWDYNDGDDINLSEIDFGLIDSQNTVTLYAVWEEALTLSGTVTIEYTYGEDETSNKPLKVPEDQRASKTELVLVRRPAGSDDDVNFEVVENATVNALFEDTSGDTSSDDYSFEGYPRTDENGVEYEYKVITTLNNYVSVYEEDSNFNFTLEYNADCVVVYFDIDASKIGESLRPSEIYVKVLFDDDGKVPVVDEDGENIEDEFKPASRGIISQHANSYVTVKPNTDNSTIYSGSYPVWKEITGTSDPYYYQMVIIGYKVQGETIMLGDNESGVYDIEYEYGANDKAGEGLFDDTEEPPEAIWAYYVGEDTKEDGFVACNKHVEADIIGLKSWNIRYIFGINKGGFKADYTSAPTEYTYGETVDPIPTSENVEREHYDFAAWKDKVQNDTNAASAKTITGISTTDHGDKTLYAWWTPISYDITYNYNNPNDTDNITKPNSDTQKYTVEDTTGENGSLTLQSPTKPGYTFDGWYTDEDCTSSNEFDPEDGGDTTVYAKWVANTYTVTFVANVKGVGTDSTNGNSGSMTSQTFTYDAAATELSENQYTAEGFKFIGWATTPNATTPVYTDEQEVENLTATNGGEIALYGVWALDAKIKIFYSYKSDSNNVEDIHEGTRAGTATIAVSRRLPTSDGEYTGDFGDFLSKTVTFNTAPETKATYDGKEYLYNEQTFAVTNPDATAIQTADETGKLYEYNTEVVLSGYDVAYGAIPPEDDDGETNIGTPGYDTNLSMTLTYNPNNFDAKFYVTFADTLPSDVKPDEVYVKIMFIQDEGETDDKGKSIEKTGTIMQHNNVYVTLTESTTNGAQDNAITYYGTYPVWKHEAGDTNELYGYKLSVIGYKLGDEVRWVKDGATGYKATYGRVNPAPNEDESVWMYYATKESEDVSSTMTALISAESYKISFELDEGTLPENTTDEYTYGEGLATLPTPSKPGYRFEGWYVMDELGNKTDISSIGAEQFGDLTIYAKWGKVSSGGSSNDSGIKVETPKNPGGSVVIDTEKPKPGQNILIKTEPEEEKKVVDIIVTDKNGNPVEVINNGDGTFVIVGPEKDITVEVVFGGMSEVVAPSVTGVGKYLEADRHIAYLNGYPDGTVRPEGNMTRAEAAQMFYNLLINRDVSSSVNYYDVEDGDWYAEAVAALSKLKVINGYEDGTFRPNDYITRAEFATMAMRFAVETGGYTVFQDVDNEYWAYGYIMSAAGYGWINGYSDSTFRPENNITRAEVAVIVNHMLYRTADKAYVNANGASLRQFTDLDDANAWYYYEMEEAVNYHDYEHGKGYSETWTGLR